jgi:hypothetical protein
VYSVLIRRALQGALGWQEFDQQGSSRYKHEVSVEPGEEELHHQDQLSAEADLPSGGGMLKLYHQLWYNKIANCKLPSKRAAVVEACDNDECFEEDASRCVPSTSRLVFGLCQSSGASLVLTKTNATS